MRPVLCSEALLKFAMGACVKCAWGQIQDAVGERQYGAGKRSGSTLEVAEVRAAASIFPDDALVGLDIENAFGAVTWADALQATIAKAPRLAVPLATMWCNFKTTVYMKDADGYGWHAFHIYGSMIQGNLEGQPGFCIVIAVVLHEVVNHPRYSPLSKRIRHWLYVDDWIMQVPVEAMNLLLDIVLEATARHCLLLQLRKCAFHIPSLRNQPADSGPEASSKWHSALNTQAADWCC